MEAAQWKNGMATSGNQPRLAVWQALLLTLRVVLLIFEEMCHLT